MLVGSTVLLPRIRLMLATMGLGVVVVSDTSQLISISLAIGFWDDESNGGVVLGGAGLDGGTRQLGSAEGPWPALPLGVWCCTGCLA